MTKRPRSDPCQIFHFLLGLGAGEILKRNLCKDGGNIPDDIIAAIDADLKALPPA